ncbi:MAG: TonB-dependent receptor [Candidatus Aminicenantes bacterium]|nr:TonB-dependent receptor [Candidatus Aminicenantes bacterium]NIM81146.1 TonB-dependent receptor [Candidatus Aminicenantes bacterium]NIN20520.1 TonB-dependent receptor [Candidatus Aminicenantes bacterium]NIN44293.1 TonB-dependent receptor [Candidatus Aminicenantes bacterium]NIN87112.1 TonB-dependent receptor [Candidatus Aminicenantes bacterium]
MIKSISPHANEKNIFTKEWHKALLALMAFSFLSTTLSAARIEGIVTDLNKNKLPNIMVVVKETGAATVTNPEGKFAIRVPDRLKSVLLIFRRHGYFPNEARVQVDNQLKTFEILFIPQEFLLQKITITATAWEKESLSVPMAEHTLSELEIQEKMPENIIDTLSESPGVHFIGSGGFSVTPTIRGLARRRVLMLVDGARITSDRRAGVSAELIPPELAERIEVVRSSSSVLYGSDAIGGVINILTRPGRETNKPELGKNGLNLNLNSVSKRINTGITFQQDLGKWHLYSGFQFTSAGDYSAPDEQIVHSGYKSYSGLLDISYKNEKREFYLGYIGGVGEDVGKPVRENDPDKYTIVPSETDHFIRLGLSEKKLVKNGTLDFSLFVNPTIYRLEKIDLSEEKLEHADTEGVNLGLKSTLKKSFSDVLSCQFGVEWFSRQNVRMKNIQQIGDGIATSTPMDNGIRNDYSLFLAFDYSGLRSLQIDGGIRYTFFSIKADVEEKNMEKNTGSYSFFLGATKKLGSSLSLFCSIGRAFRFPSLGESLYTGLTGRRYVVGNPFLKPESSLNIDAGLKMAAKRLSLGLYLFAYHIDHMIERYRNEENIYTYDNINRGRILGGEIEVWYSPAAAIDFFGHYFYYHGRSDTNDEPLNDVPAPRLMLGGKFFWDRLWLEVSYIHSFKKTDPGPAEVENNPYNVLTIKGGYYFTSTFYIYLKLANILNESYYPNPDPDIPYAQGFNVSAGVHLYF